MELEQLKREMHELFQKQVYSSSWKLSYGALDALAEKLYKAGQEAGREEYRDHLRFLYRWISRLNGDKPHDRPETQWKEYVAAMVNYPSSPWETGDWFEEPLEATKNPNV